MPYDSFAVSCAAKELDCLLRGGKINKITQPDAHSVVLHIYSKKTYMLLLGARPEFSRVHITRQQRENPALPFPFCMSLRKNLSGAEILSVSAIPFERAVVIDFLCLTELKDKAVNKLIIEITGRQSNIILCRQNFDIIYPLKSVSLGSGPRVLLPGVKYCFPQNNKILLSDKIPSIKKLQNFEGGGEKLADFIFTAFAGFSLPTAAVAAEFAGGAESAEKLYDALLAFSEKFSPESAVKPCILLDENGGYEDFFAFPYYPGRQYKFFDSLNDCIDEFYSGREFAKRLGEKKRAAMQSLKSGMAKAQKKIAALNDDLIKSQNAETLRIKGELLTANLYLLKGKEVSFKCKNYYSAEGADITIELNPSLTPSQNAQSYFKRYAKSKNAREAILGQLNEAKLNLEYYSSALLFLENAATVAEAEEIAGEIFAQKPAAIKAKSGVKNKNGAKAAPAAKKQSAKPDIYIYEVDGCVIYSGKNNTQNDYVTFKLARSEDLWFHVQGKPGPHAVLKGENVTQNAILEAAKCAARFSTGGKEAVDYTQKKHVKKPSGSPAGFVVYSNFNTVTVKV